jgi:OmpA-like transmembrane domain
MKTFGLSVLLLSFAAVSGFAQQWEVGGMGGASFLNSVAVSNSTGSARAGFQPGAALGAYVGYNTYKHIGGELHYEFLQSNLKLSSGGSTATFSGMAHMVHYDVTFHTARSESKVQWFAAVGGGMKVFRGTGTEHSTQALEQFGLFTKTQEMKPMATVGGGVKWNITKRVFLRTEIRDYVTAFPKGIITPPGPDTKYGFLLHDIVPTVGLGFVM